MCRFKRIKTDDSTVHIILRSISQVSLLKNDNDKDRYMNLVKKYQKLYKFQVYGYCLMDNHTHMIIYVNGSNISKIMHLINFSYA